MRDGELGPRRRRLQNGSGRKQRRWRGPLRESESDTREEKRTKDCNLLFHAPNPAWRGRRWRTISICHSGRRRGTSGEFKSCSLMRILSGIQPTGILHIGNYFGMMRPAIALQESAANETFYFIADYHALTTIDNPETLRANSRRIALDFLACGLDVERGALFRQSDVPQVAELTWILSTVTPKALLERGHSYKDKIARGLPASAGLFNYPVLMAADILIYDSDLVPVGKDQKQHLEMTRDIALKFNETFGSEPDVQIFKLPEPQIQAATETVPGIDGQKMSKSYGNTIDIFGDEKETRKRVMSIVTDSQPVEAPKDPASSTIFQLYSLVAQPNELSQMRDTFQKGGTGYGDFKKQLFGKLWEYFGPMRKRRGGILQEPGYNDSVPQRRATRANQEAGKVMKRVREAVGLERLSA